MTEELVKALDGNTFVVSDARGDIEASPTDPTGLFSYDTRFLSRWVLTVDDHRLTELSTDDLNYFETKYFLVPGTGTVYVDAKMSVIRQRAVVDGFREQVTILNHDAIPVRLTLRIDVAADFADLFEVKDALVKKGRYYLRPGSGVLVIGYERDTYRRETEIHAADATDIAEDAITFDVTIDGHSQWTTELRVVPRLLRADGRPLVTSRRNGHGQQDLLDRLQRWIGGAPRLVSDWEPLGTTYRRSLVDLAALRFSPTIAG